MSTRAFDLTTTVPVAPTDAIDFLLDLSRHHGLHPYVQSATVTDSGVDDHGSWAEWDVVERPALGPFRYTIRFPARMIRTSDSSMVGRVRAARGCYLETTTLAEASADGTVLTERTVVTAPAPLVGYMTKHAHLAHARTFRLLPAELATSAG